MTADIDKMLERGFSLDSLLEVGGSSNIQDRQAILFAFMTDLAEVPSEVRALLVQSLHQASVQFSPS